MVGWLFSLEANMPWLYEHRYEYDEELRRFIEIAHWATKTIPPEDWDDVEQDIIIQLLAVDRHGFKPNSYLRAVARNEVCRYLRQKYKEARIFHHIFESERGEMVRGMWKVLHDGDGRLDAIATLATLPRRLIEIGYKRLNGEKLSEADQSYEIRQRAKLNCRRHPNRLSHWEKRRILQLHSEGLSMSRIARTLGRSNKAVMGILAGNRLSRQKWLSRMKAAAQQRDEQIRLAYLQGKGISQIARELHVASATVGKIARTERQRETARVADTV
jgi:DNA-directed RNA polymerase specialized sigma24 family protein